MKHINFIVKAASLVLALGVLAVYSLIAADRQNKLKEYESKVAEIEAHNARALNRRSDAPASRYRDGVYEGSARGFRGEIAVVVTVENGAITAVEIASAEKEDVAYLIRAKKVIESIIEKQSAEVDAISGATFSSNGIRSAVIEALKAAEG